MTVCPRCAGILALGGEGLLRDAHGVFLPASAIRGSVDRGGAAMLAAAIGRGATGPLACPSCRSPMRVARVPIPGQPDLEVDGCLVCGGCWFDRGELGRLRAAMLARPRETPRVLGGYGGNTVSRGVGHYSLAEFVSLLLQSADASAHAL